MSAPRPPVRLGDRVRAARPGKGGKRLTHEVQDLEWITGHWPGPFWLARAKCGVRFRSPELAEGDQDCLTCFSPWTRLGRPAPPPATFAEYERRMAVNTKVTGYGIEGVTTHMPCPWCAAPDWLVFRIIDTKTAMKAEGTTCAECGRTGRFIFHVDTPAETAFELVQTGGPDPPAFFKPPPRRV